MFEDATTLQVGWLHGMVPTLAELASSNCLKDARPTGSKLLQMAFCILDGSQNDYRE